jgi:hypothetical protein
MNRNAVSTLLSLAIVFVVFYMFKDKLKAVISGNLVGNSIRGFPALGVPTAPSATVNVPFALTAATGDQFPNSALPPGYYRNSTGGVSAYPDPSGIGGGFAT